MKTLKCLITLFTLMLLVGCASTGGSSSASASKTQKPQAANQLKYWEMEGRFALRHDKQSGSASIKWLNNNQSYAIKISGPMSQGTLMIASNGETVILTDSKGQQHHAPTPEALLNQFSQMDLPVSSLRYWLVGSAAPNMSADKQYNAQGQLSEITQKDWTIRYTQYRKVANSNSYLPKKVIIEHPDVKMTFSIHNWNVSQKPYV